MSKLNTEPRIADPDGLYEAILAAHRDLDEAESRKLDAKLILLLANHIGDAGTVREALAIARAGARPEARTDAAAEGPESAAT